MVKRPLRPVKDWELNYTAINLVFKVKNFSYQSGGEDAPLMTAVMSRQQRARRAWHLLHKSTTYLILRETPWGTPTLTVAPRMLCRLIFLSAPYSTTVPKKPDLQPGKKAKSLPLHMTRQKYRGCDCFCCSNSNMLQIKDRK